jgi:hypothetical protein
MTTQEIAQRLESLIREDAQRPIEDQIRDLIEAGVIDKQGRVLVGSWNQSRQVQKPDQQNGPSEEKQAE